MTDWLGKFWPLRLLLWFFAAALCFVIWPMAVWDVLPRGRLEVLARYFDDRSYFGNPVLLQGAGVEAWDWKTGQRWRVPASTASSTSVVEVIDGGRTLALAELDWSRGIVVTDVMPPHEQRIYPLPKDWQNGPVAMIEQQGMWSKSVVVEQEDGQLVMIDQRMKYAVVGRYEQDGMAIHVVELATGQVVDTRTNVDQAFTLGDGELELTQMEQISSPTPDLTVRSSRWKLADNGQLVASEKAPVFQEPDASLQPGTYVVVSPDGRYEALQPAASPVVIRERSSGRVLERLPLSGVFVTEITFSTDSKSLLVGSHFTNFRVFDLESQSLVAEDQRVERRQWRSSILMGISVVPLLLALILTLRTPSFERMAWDYLLATAFCDSCLTALALQYHSLLGINCVLGALMAIGVYWAFGPQALWKRLICGIAATAVMLGIPAGIAAQAAQSLVTYGDVVQSVTMSFFIATMCGVSAWLMTLPLGWRIARDEYQVVSPRFQFGIGALCLTITIAAVTFAVLRHLFAESDSETILFEGVAAAATLLIAASTVWLFLWLWFRRHTWRSFLLAVTGGGTILMLLFVGLTAVRLVLERGGFDLNATTLVGYETFFFLAPLAVPLAWFSFALWLARRHGYRWVKANKPVPVVDDALGAAA